MAIMEVSQASVFVCAVANMILGMVWYNPKTPLGKAWMKEGSHSPEKMNKKQKKMMSFSYAVAFLCAYMMAYVLGHILVLLEVSTLNAALKATFWIWFGFIATVGTGVVLWEGKSWKLWAINTGYYLLAMAMMSMILFAMGS